MPEMEPADLDNLTTLLDNYNYDNENFITPQSLHATWWPGLNQLREATNKQALLEDWKYKKDLLNVEYCHTHGENRYVAGDNWEQRFVLALWLSIYH
jgi:hypothetical protein